MRYHIKERAWSLTEAFLVRDDAGQPVFEIRGKFFHIGDNLVMYDRYTGQELVHIKQRVISLLPHYEIYRNGQHWASMHEQFRLFGEAFKARFDGRDSARLFLEFQAMRRALAKVAGTLSIPTLLIQGGADPVSSCLGCAQWAKAAKPGMVTYKEYPGLFHEVLNEPEGAAILDEIIAWLKQVLSAPRQEGRAASNIATASFHPR